MSKQKQYQLELDKWNELFSLTTPETQKAASGLIAKAAYVHSLCWELEQAIIVSGAIKIHPENPTMQRAIPALKEYSRMTDNYANIVNKLNGLRVGNVIEEDDELGEYE
ncbi:hypothetical protein [Pelosinus propionicus]|uniref:Phage terminase, small subunit n=1 Tax=Pelosinus propionicus DSM 13327 TaxID=1123291 RepID=A0A1I4N1V8_9FIRM|nr:hypothetical protein [Pelosinus propionicus]SFM09306.1 hypothetical protein SAMN04490355_104031 [Pelosinus propionicus DSM 13327]